MCACARYSRPSAATRPRSGESSFGLHAVVMNHFMSGAYYPVGGAEAFANGVTLFQPRMNCPRADLPEHRRDLWVCHDDRSTPEQSLQIPCSTFSNKYGDAEAAPASCARSTH